MQPAAVLARTLGLLIAPVWHMARRRTHDTAKLPHLHPFITYGGMSFVIPFFRGIASYSHIRYKQHPQTQQRDNEEKVSKFSSRTS